MPADASKTLADLADRLLESVLVAEPLEATLTGFRQYDALLADLSREAEVSLLADLAGMRAKAMAIDPQDLSAQESVTRSVIIAITEYSSETIAAGLPEFTVAAFPVSPSSILLSYLNKVVATDEREAMDYLQRLARIPDYLDQAETRLAHGRSAGLSPVAHLVDMAVEQIDRFLAADPCPLVIDAPDGWDGADGWRASLDTVIEQVVRPAFAAHRNVLLTDVKPVARSSDVAGLVHLPDGMARYRGLVRVHTTTDRTPEELHQTGLDAVARNHAEFRELGSALFGLSDIAEIFAHLQSDPSLRWGSAQEILAAAEVTVRRAEAASVEWFGRVPEAICQLEPIPELEAAGAAPAYYMPPAIDGSRPGIYFTNINSPSDRTSFDLESIAFHEAVPGHHFQISLALELPDLPVIRRLPMFTAYVEGWGLYSERLADEMGLYSSQLQRMGMLSADVWRASRLVVDTGIHAFGWSRQKAVDYLLENTPVAPIDVESEIDRYIAYPGQALAYMTGRMEIEALRAQAQAALGDVFDVRAFHDLVLGSGALPLSVLAELVQAWVAESMENAAG